MSQYKSHRNPLEVHCAQCHKEITLEAQEIVNDRVLCSSCFDGDEYSDDD